MIHKYLPEKKHVTHAAILGAMILAAGFPIIAQIVFIFTNGILAIFNYSRKDMDEFKMFSAYLLISIIGVLKSIFG